MNGHYYLFEYEASISRDEILQMMQKAELAAEFLHGSEAVRLDGGHRLGPASRKCLIDGSTAVGCDLARLFSGYLGLYFGPDAFEVRRREGEFVVAAFGDQSLD